MRLWSEKRGSYLGCDATDPREGRGDGKPCSRRVVVEQRREAGDTAWVMHYCERHRDRKPSPGSGVRLLGTRDLTAREVTS